MARPVIFHYRPGDDRIRNVATWIKLVFASALAIGISSGPIWSLWISLAIIISIGLVARVPFTDVLRIWPLAFFLLTVTVFLPLWHSTTPCATIITGSIRTIRFVLLFWAGNLLTAVTSPASLSLSLQRALFWLGPRRSRTAGVLASLALVAMAGILDRAQTVREAALLRGWNPRRRPLLIVKLWTLVLLRNLLERGLWTAYSMELRGWKID